MKRTHMSLYYLIGYLIPGGTALLSSPQLTLKLFFSNTDYGDVLPRLVGMLMLALGIFVLQAVRHRLEVLYSTALIVRSGMLPHAGALSLFRRSSVHNLVGGRWCRRRVDGNKLLVRQTEQGAVRIIYDMMVMRDRL